MTSKIAKIPFVSALVLMLIPASRAKAASDMAFVKPAVHTQCNFYANYKQSGGSIVCYGGAGTACAVC